MKSKRQRWQRHDTCTLIVESANEALEFTITRCGRERYKAVVKEGYLQGEARVFHWYGGLHLWLLTEGDVLKFRSLRRAQRACRIFSAGWLGGRRVPTDIATAVQRGRYQRAVGSIAVA